jgi:hypothetical protein
LPGRIKLKQYTGRTDKYGPYKCGENKAKKSSAFFDRNCWKDKKGRGKGHERIKRIAKISPNEDSIPFK